MTANKLEGKAREAGMLPDALVPHAKEWYRLCERRFSVDRMTISGQLAEAIVDAICALDTARQPDTIHSCSYYCDRPDCVKAQRDELREKYVARQSEGMVCIGWEFNDPRDELGWQRLHGVGPASSPPYADPVQVRRIFAAAPADAGEVDRG